jgi:hypothetical protein
LSRHRKIQLSRAKAILVAAGALSVATAASATAATWNSGPTASAHLNSAHLNSAHLNSSTKESSARLTVTDQLVAPQAEVAYQQTSAQQTSATLAQRAYQLRAAQARYATAKWTAAHKQAQAKQAQAKQPAKQAQATASMVTVTAPSGSPQQIAEAMLGSFGWSSGQFSCLDPLWAHESGWSVTAYNAGSGAYGIPQALPGSRMASAGPDWQTSAATQIRWGLEYIKGTYGSPCGAWDHEQATGWY